MMKKVDLHIHSTYSDGNNSLEEIIKEAIKDNIDIIGFSDHSYTPFDLSYCIRKEDINNYRTEIIQLKEKYKNEIQVLLGIEQDYYSDKPTEKYDYIIGSVHYIHKNGEYIPIDESKEILIDAVNKYYNGDIYDLIDDYYKTVSKILEKTDADIIGHIDLISKFNEDGILFDENNSRYINAYKKACEYLLNHNVIFEINTGAISRGYRTNPYPSMQIYKYLRDNGAKFILSSDSHSKDTLCYDFDKYNYLI